MSVYRFTRLQSHDRGDEHCSAAATAQTFFLNPRRPRSSSRPMIRNVMTPSQESNGDDRSFSPCTAATIRPRYYTDTQQEPRAFGEYNVLYIYMINLYITLYIATSHIGQIFCRSRHFICLSLFYIIIYAIRYLYCTIYVNTHYSHTLTHAHVQIIRTAVNRVLAIGQVQR